MPAPPATRRRTGRSGIRTEYGAVNIDILDEIDPLYGVSASQVMTTLRENPGAPARVAIASPGGDAFEGLAIYELLRQHSGRVTVEVLGLAASAASIIAMGGDEILIGQGGMIMIHSASCLTWGNAAQLRETVALLEKVDQTLAGIYAARAGGLASDWLKAMQRESWYGPKDAVDAGLADRLMVAPRESATASARLARRAAVRANAPNLGQHVRAALSTALHPRPARVTNRRIAPSAMNTIKALHAVGARPWGVAP
jgi:ATP-dependent protease ClpP protease subunit